MSTGQSVFDVTLTTSDPDLDAHLSAAFSRDLTMMNSAPAGLLVEFPTSMLGGDMANATEKLRLAGEAPAGTFFDYPCVHLIATSTLDRLQACAPGRTARRAAFPAKHCDPTASCPRCINTVLPQPNLPRDPHILRKIAQNNTQDLDEFGKLPCAGVQADVLSAGSIRCRDTVRCLD